MLTNPDGTRYCLESVEEIIRERCAAQDFPRLTDVLGSDWSAAFGWAPVDADKYLANALRAARYSYKPAA
jgi:hypothetical protein